MEQQIRFCLSADGTRIAYADLGEGPSLVVVFSWPTNLDLDWEYPASRAWLEKVASKQRFVRFDRRGVGASQRDVQDISMATQVADLAAVVNHLELEQFSLWGFGDGAAVGVVYAAQHPERLSRLILWDSYAHGPGFAPPDMIQSLAAFVVENWSMARRSIADTIFPTGPMEAQRWLSHLMSESMTADMAASYIRFQFGADIRSELPRVRTPTLVFHRRGDRIVPIRAGQEAASLIADARFVALEGDIGYSFYGESAHVAIVEEFLREGVEGERQKAAIPSGTAVILFADVADSTALTERLGDAAFRAKAHDLDGALRTVIGEHAGTPIEGKLLGDGVLAVFTSAAKAIEAALACGRAGADGGLPLHLGIHAGDVIREDDNVYGGAVNIASRISGLSAPGEVLVSRTVADLARTSAGVRFEDRGEQSLKGVGEAVRVWAVRKGGE